MATKTTTEVLPKAPVEEAKIDLFEDDDEFEEFEIDQVWDAKEDGKEVTQQWEDDWDDDDVNDDFSLQLKRELESNTEKNPTFIKIIKNKSVQSFKPDPYLATLVNCAMWLFYGLPIVHPHSLLLVTVNSAGILITLTFCSIYFFFCPWPSRRKMIIILTLEALFVTAMVAVTLTVSHTHPTRIMLVGVLCVILNIVMYTSPLTIMRTVIRTKSVKYMPICLSIGNLLNGTIWIIYAALEFDPFIMIPNIIGAISGTIQIGLYAKYNNTTNWDELPNEVEMP